MNVYTRISVEQTPIGAPIAEARLNTGHTITWIVRSFTDTTVSRTALTRTTTPRVAFPAIRGLIYRSRREVELAKHTTSRRFQKLRKEFFEQGKRDNSPCWICGQPIDYSIPNVDPVSGKINWEAHQLDHLLPQSKYPEHAEDLANARHSHSRCNNDRSNDAPSRSITKPSRRWLK